MAICIDEKIISDIAAGNGAAFREFYNLTSEAVYGFALSILKNSHDAEDIMQETYVKIYNSADTYTHRGRPMAWVFTIVKNLCYNKIRKNRQHEDITDYMHSISDKSRDDRINAMVLEEAMNVLNEEERQIVILHAMTGMKHREIAEILNMPVSTVLSKYNRSLKKLKKALEEREV